MALTSKGSFAIGTQEFNAKSLKVNYDSLATEDSGRADNGTMKIDWVYKKLRQIEIELPPCSSEEVSRLLNLIQGKEYQMKYFDPLLNNWRTSKFYTSSSKTDLYSGVVLNGVFQGVGFKAIELAGEN